LDTGYQEKANEAATLEELLKNEREKVNQLESKCQDLADVQSMKMLHDVCEQATIQSKQVESLNKENQKIKQDKEGLIQMISTLEKSFQQKVQLEVENIMGQRLGRIKRRRSSLPETHMRRSNISSELPKNKHKKKTRCKTVQLDQNPQWLLDLLINKQDSLRFYGKSQGDLYDSIENVHHRAKTLERYRKKTKLYKSRRDGRSKKEISLDGANSSCRRVSSSYDSQIVPAQNKSLSKFANSDSCRSWGQSESLIKVITGSLVKSQLSIEEKGDASLSELSGNLPRTEKSLFQAENSGSRSNSYQIDVHSRSSLNLKSQKTLRSSEEVKDRRNLSLPDNVSIKKRRSARYSVKNSLVSPMVV